MKSSVVRFALLFSIAASVGAATEPPASLLATWVAMDAPTGHEHHATAAIQAELDGWSADPMGNLFKDVGAGPGLQVVACLLDAPAFAVSEIRDDGFLRLHHIGRSPAHPLWSQAHEGQQLRILTAAGPVIGVTALANGHFMNLHRDETLLTRADDLWLDVGASSRDDVAEIGIELLDPVTRHLPPWHFEGWIAGPSAGARLGCATVVSAAEAGIAGKGRVRYLLSVQSAFRGVGLSAALAGLEGLERVILLSSGREITATDDAERPVFPERLAAFDTSLLTEIYPEVEDAGALMEAVHVDEAQRLAEELLRQLGANQQILEWVAAPMQAPVRNRDPAWLGGVDSSTALSEFADSLRTLGELYAVSKYETSVRNAVASELPPWAKALSQTDEIGNLWVDTGPSDAEATVFMAHMDEVGWKIAAIHRDGTIDLTRQGGALSLAWEGQPALLQISGQSGRDAPVDPDMLRGKFLNRDQPHERWPETLQAWVGLDREALVAKGVSVGMPVTGYKEAHRLGRHRFTVRGMDDRVGTAALLAAVKRINPDTLKHRVVFAWSVQEEGGLHGAVALAQRLALSTRRIYSIDTFVTSDTPLESHHFAHAPLGGGPVLRSMESTGLVRPAELARNKAIAASAGIDVQLGITQGGTDGTAFTYYGAPNAGLSWPGRYSHGPAELGDLRDMVKLVELIEAFALANP